MKIYFLEPYPLHLDLLLTIYTAFLSNGATDLAQNRRPVFSQRSIPNVATVAATANLFPIRNTSDHLDLHHASETLTNELYRVPLHYTPGQAMSSLMTLHSYLAGGHEIPDARILVCVASIGPRRRVVVKSQQTHVDLCECLLADHTASIRLTLWGADPAVTPLRAGWIPHTTVLLIARPVFRLDFRGQPSIALQRASVVDTNPQFPDVCWLRGWAERRARRDSVAGRYVEAEWDVEDAVSGADRALFSLAEVDEWCVLNMPCDYFTKRIGYGATRPSRLLGG